MAGDATEYIGNIPQQYDRNLGPVLFVDYAADISRRVAAYSPQQVLEIAAGTGIVTRQLRNQLPAGVRLTATDLNAPMLEIARSKFRPDESVEFQPADATALPFPDKNFDAVVCQFGVMFFPDKDKSYREVFRVLVPGGHYVFSVWDSHRHNPIGRIAHEVIGSFFPADPPQFQSVPFAYRFEPIKDSLIDAGFTDISAVVLQLRKDVPDLASLARGLVYGSPIIDQVGQRGGVEAEQIVDAIVREYRNEFGSYPPNIPLQAIVFSAEKPF
ncbi:MAG TPA: methyltransferase domain-containing protein [Pseudolabrys sp.]|jgi:ubiquinone/menaquinone biosynthesis C-methylase UbiE|nr:methyltransferase domain-containing protein [Pseudolabrys sp.]